jgi:hypothetical protein
MRRRFNPSTFAVKTIVVVLVMLAFALTSAAAGADTWQAPIGGKAIALAEGRIACPGTSGDWTLEQEGRAVRPPTRDESIGKVVALKVAASAEACGAAAETLTLVATGRWPTIDPTATTVFVDDARVELAGRGLGGISVHWQLGNRSGDDRCIQSRLEAGGSEKCAVAIGRGLPADPAVVDLSWLPAGARSGPGVVTFDPAGLVASSDETGLRAARVVVSSLVAQGVAVDLAGGTASRVPLLHPEAVVGADCGAASCDVSAGAVVVGGISSVSGALSIRLRLAPRVALFRDNALDFAPVVQVSVLPCPMSIASGDAIRGADASRVVVRVDARCKGEVPNLRWYSAGRSVDALSAVDESGSAYVLLGVGRIEGDEIVVTANRNGPDPSIVGQARARTRAAPSTRSTLTLAEGENIDFVPTNRPAALHWARSQGGGELTPLALEGAYDVRTRDGATFVQGLPGAGGFVALRFAWRVPTLPGALSAADLVVVTDPLERPVHEASMPAPLGASAVGPSPIVELLCGDGDQRRRIAPGSTAHVPFAERDACRLVFHRERLSAEQGVQHIQLTVEVTRVDGESRPESHVVQSMTLRAAAEPRYAWIKGVLGSFDRAIVRVSHTADPELADGGSEEPSAQWSIVFGTGHFRLYATTAIPTGLYRVSDRAHSGILSLNLGGVVRGTWLDAEGHEGFLGLEAGMMAEGLANDTDASGQHSLTQVATVTGIGLSVPIANRSLATETSINLHAWFEYEVSRDIGNEPGSPFGFVFGPSISIGNVGTNF